MATVVTGVLALAVGPTSASSTADFVADGRGMDIVGSVGGVTETGWAGELLVSLDGGPSVVAYCIDFLRFIDEATGADLRETGWDTSDVANLDSIQWVITNYSADSDALVGADVEKAAAIQAAIWTLTDGYVLSPADNAAAVVANHATILSSIPPAPLPGEPASGLSVSPGSADASAGGIAGPFVVDTTAASVAVDAPGAEVVDWATGTTITTAVDGTSFGVRSNDPGSVTVTLTANGPVAAGRVFGRFDVDGTPLVQSLVLAAPGTADLQAAAIAEFAPVATTTTVPESTTTTVPESTTTTVPESTTTTVPESTTTTVPETTTTTVDETTTTTVDDPTTTTTEDPVGSVTIPGPVAPTTVPTEVAGVVIERPQLPRTGRNTGLALGAGAAVMLFGAALVAAERRSSSAS